MDEQKMIANKIRAQYAEGEHTPLDALKALDATVKKPARVFAYTFGILGAIIMGAGMSLVMTDIGTVLGITSTTVPGILTGLAGFAMCCITYPIYQKILAPRKKKYAQQIMELSDRITKG